MVIKDDKKYYDVEYYRDRELGISNFFLVLDSLRGIDKCRNGFEFFNDIKKRKVDDKDFSYYDSDGDKSDDNLVVDVFNEDFFFLWVSFVYLFWENGIDKNCLLKKDVFSSLVFMVFLVSFIFLKFKEMSLYEKVSMFVLKFSILMFWSDMLMLGISVILGFCLGFGKFLVIDFFVN